MTNDRRLRVLVAKPGLDGHERGAHVVARALRDAGIEVIYSGIRQSAAAIAMIAVQEDVDCVGLSILSGSHLEHSADVVQELIKIGAPDITVIVGGIIPAEDVEEMHRLGVRAVFGPGTPTKDIVAAIRGLTTPIESEAKGSESVATQRD